jgi:hypothetical protein
MPAPVPGCTLCDTPLVLLLLCGPPTHRAAELALADANKAEEMRSRQAKKVQDVQNEAKVRDERRHHTGWLLSG